MLNYTNNHNSKRLEYTTLSEPVTVPTNKPSFEFDTMVATSKVLDNLMVELIIMESNFIDSFLIGLQHDKIEKVEALLNEQLLTIEGV